MFVECHVMREMLQEIASATVKDVSLEHVYIEKQLRSSTVEWKNVNGP